MAVLAYPNSSGIPICKKKILRLWFWYSVPLAGLAKCGGYFGELLHPKKNTEV